MTTDPPNSRRLLVELAAEAFAEQGYAGVSVRDLAARSGLTTGAIYHNFKGKPDLLLAAIDAHIADDLVNLPSDGSETIAGVLANIFAHYPDRERLRALLVEGVTGARGDPEAGDRLREDTERRLRDWSEVYREWQENGEIDESLDIRAVVVSLWSMELGLGVLEALGVDLPPTKAMGEVMDHFTHGLAPAPSSMTGRGRTANERGASDQNAAKPAPKARKAGAAKPSAAKKSATSAPSGKRS